MQGYTLNDLQEEGINQVKMDSQEISTTNITPSCLSTISHPMLEEWSNSLG
jgi:hypothetical protein